jgi:hypothetical protein
MLAGMGSFWNWVVPTGMERMAANHSSNRQPTTVNNAKPFDGCESVFGTGGIKPTPWTQQGRNQQLVRLNQPHQENFEGFSQKTK